LVAGGDAGEVRKVYDSPAFEKVGHFQSILESAGIATLIKNEALNEAPGAFSALGEYPELWVMDDGEYERAVEILRPYYEGKG
jgi:hypothetical protein